MLINIGRLLMISVWGFMLFNLIHPFPKPLKYFMDIAMIFMVIMHALQTLFMKSTLPKGEKMPLGQQIRLFFFGVFELLSIQKVQKAQFAERKQKSDLTNRDKH
nr:DUF1145 family protein [uncultured Moellerella sp.]